MKHLLILLSFLILSINGFAQKADTTWFTNKWEKTDKQHGHYYRVTIKDEANGIYRVKDYHPNGKVQMEGSYLSFDPEVKHGDFTWWYTTGLKRLQASYDKDIRMKYIEWDADGKVIGQEELMPSKRIENGKEVNVLVRLDSKPEFPGGMAALSKFLSENIKYPKSAYRNKITGKVLIGFTVTKTGKLVDAKVINSVEPSLDEEALRVVKLLPDWTPAKLDGRAINVKFTLPINFAL